jgi:ABC-type transport system substrate-binding protein
MRKGLLIFTARCRMVCRGLIKKRPRKSQIPLTKFATGMRQVMRRILRHRTAVVLIALLVAAPASAQKRGGVLRIFQYDSPASMSIHEEALNSAQNPMMAVFNNLVIFKQDVPQNRMHTIVPDLATKWFWNPDMTELTFQLRHGVSWHDGKPLSCIS